MSAYVAMEPFVVARIRECSGPASAVVRDQPESTWLTLTLHGIDTRSQKARDHGMESLECLWLRALPLEVWQLHRCTASSFSRTERGSPGSGNSGQSRQ